MQKAIVYNSFLHANYSSASLAICLSSCFLFALSTLGICNQRRNEFFLPKRKMQKNANFLSKNCELLLGPDDQLGVCETSQKEQLPVGGVPKWYCKVFLSVCSEMPMGRSCTRCSLHDSSPCLALSYICAFAFAFAFPFVAFININYQ